MASLDIRPNVQVSELQFLQAISVMRLRHVVLILREMPMVMIDDLPMRQFANPTDELQSNHLILSPKLSLQTH
jgi:hypothetical protein